MDATGTIVLWISLLGAEPFSTVSIAVLSSLATALGLLPPIDGRGGSVPVMEAESTSIVGVAGCGRLWLRLPIATFELGARDIGVEGLVPVSEIEDTMTEPPVIC